MVRPNPDAHGPAVVMHGNISDGFDAHGPFPDWDDAAQWTVTDAHLDHDTWIMSLNPPGDEKPEEHPVFKKGETKPHIEDDGLIYGVVEIDLNDIIEGNLESFLDLLSTELTGSDYLSDMQYSVVGHKADNQVLIEVCGDPSLILEHSADLKKQWDAMEQRLADKGKSKDRHQRKRKKS
jgi:hypothetical protein